MKKQYLSKKIHSLQKMNWLVLFFIFLVVIAGSFVRVTGSGMGCPDWPRCFGSWIPPTHESELPDNYQAHYREGRIKKIDKFTRILTGIGFQSSAEKIKNVPNLLDEQRFNAAKTWTEYVNRLCGFLAGNGMLIAFIWLLLVYRNRQLIILSSINLIILLFQAWFGSIVVASNLLPWTITIHLFLALLILGLQLYLIHLLGIHRSRQSESSYKSPIYTVPRWMFWVIFISALITSYQIFLGTQVRELVDQITTSTQQNWSSELGWSFFIHRSFAWIVLLAILFLAWQNEKREKFKPIRWLVILLMIELLSGIILVYAGMPKMVQISHLFFAVILFCVFVMMIFRLKIQHSTS